MIRLHYLPLASVVVAVALSGCATDNVKPSEPKIVIQRVEIPVTAPCLVKVAVPIFVDTDAALRAAPNIFERARLLTAGRLQHWAYEGELLAAQSACPVIPPK